MPKVSVIMPVYNGEKYLQEAIDSILGQTYQDFEFIVINDCSTDRTEDIILSYTDSRLIYVKNDKNLRIAATLNKGLNLAKGEYIARMDADDIAVPCRFERQVDILDKKPRLGVVGSSVILFGEEIPEQEFMFPTSAKQTKANMFYFTSLAHPTVMIRKEILNKYKLCYELDYEGLEDYVLWWRIAKYSDIASIKRPLLYYRQHKGQVTKNYDDIMKQKLNRFLTERLSVFGEIFTVEEENLLLDYCCNSWEMFDYNRIVALIDLLSNVLKKNRTIKYYAKKELRHTIELSVSYTIQNVKVANKKALYKYAIKQGVLSSVMTIKLVLKGHVL